VRPMKPWHGGGAVAAKAAAAQAVTPTSGGSPNHGRRTLNPPSTGSTSPWQAMAGGPRGCGRLGWGGGAVWGATVDGSTAVHQPSNQHNTTRTPARCWERLGWRLRHRPYHRAAAAQSAVRLQPQQRGLFHRTSLLHLLASVSAVLLCVVCTHVYNPQQQHHAATHCVGGGGRRRSAGQ